MLDANGHSIFGSIDQLVVQYPVPRKRNEGAAEEVVEEAGELAESVDTSNNADVES